MVYDFLQELLHNQSVSDMTWAAAQKMFGDQGVIDMTVHCGYYSLLAMVMNTMGRLPSRTPVALISRTTW